MSTRFARVPVPCTRRAARSHRARISWVLQVNEDRGRPRALLNRFQTVVGRRGFGRGARAQVDLGATSFGVELTAQLAAIDRRRWLLNRPYVIQSVSSPL